MKQIACLSSLLLSLSSMAFAGTAFIDFEHNTGLFDLTAGERLTSSGGRAHCTAYSMSYLLYEGDPVRHNGGTLSTSITLTPSQDAGESLVGLYLKGQSWTISGGCYGDGRITLSGGPHPGATLEGTLDNPDSAHTLTLTYTLETDTATLFVDGTLKLTFASALGSPYRLENFGVVCTGPGSFDDFYATGPDVPDYPLPDSDSDGVPNKDDAFPSNPHGQTDTDGDGIGDEWEMVWFSDLTTAGALTDYDNDGVSDREEFDAYQFNCDPTDGATALPGNSLAGLWILGISLPVACLCVLRRHRAKS